MPQGPFSTYPPPVGTKSKLFISGAPVLVKGNAGVATPGFVGTVTVLAAGSGTGTVNDCTATGAAVTANEIAVIPETVGPLVLNFPFATGLVITPGTGQELSVSYT
jgi:hypothetical protein